MSRILRISFSLLYKEMERKKPSRFIKNGNISWIILPRLLLALFSINGSIRMDEYSMDGSICWNNIWRKNMVKRDIDFKIYRNCFCYCRNSDYIRNNNII